jgi:hypothetical protein
LDGIALWLGIFVFVCIEQQWMLWNMELLMIVVGVTFMALMLEIVLSLLLARVHKSTTNMLTVFIEQHLHFYI